MQKRLATFWMVSQAIMCTLRYSFLGLFDAVRGTLTRAKANHYLQTWARLLLRSVDAHIRVEGHVFLENLGNRHCIFMSNHESLYDIPVLMHVLPGSLRMLAKSELFRVPVWGRAMRAAQFVPLHRGVGKQALSDLADAKRLLSQHIRLWVSPEGTRPEKSGKLLPFKSGGFRLAHDADALIIPIGIVGTSEILPARAMQIQTGMTVVVRIGKPIDTRLYTNSDRRALMEKTTQSITDLMREAAQSAQMVSMKGMSREEGSD